MLLVILTVGFNVVSTLCGACSYARTEFSYIALEAGDTCDCCNGESCCSCSDDQEESENRKETKYFFAKLNVLAQQQNQLDLEEVLMPVVIFLLNQVEFNLSIQNTICQSDNKLPYLTRSGRSILSLICTLRR